jgi:hypothetical protein
MIGEAGTLLLFLAAVYVAGRVFGSSPRRRYR